MAKPVIFENRESIILDQPGKQIRVISQALGFSFGPPFSLVWNRPMAVKIRLAGGEEVVLPVRDMTRIFQVGILLIGLVGITALYFLKNNR